MGLGKYIYAYIGIYALLLFLTGYGITQLSGEIAIHFDSSGTADGYMPLIPGIILMPGIATALLIFFHYAPRIDPLGENYESFEDLFEILKLLVLGIFTYIQGLILAWNLGYRFDISVLLAPVVFSAYLLAGKLMEKAERNWFIGIRTPWTLSSDEVWEETHEKTAPLMKAASFIALIAVIWPEFSVYFYAVPAFAIALFSTLYSFVVYRDIS